MIATRINLKGFKCFKDDITFKLDRLNLITGDNGIGKSTLARDSFLFCLFGYSNTTLEKLANRKLKNKEYKVRIEFEEQKKKIIIERKFPSSLTIYEDGIKLDFNNKEAQEYIGKLFKNLDYFKKFRTIDSEEGINVLGEGKTSIKKTLLSFQEDWFNSIRQQLLDKKREREFYNKDKCISNHYPSEKRLGIINKYIDRFTDGCNNFKKEIENQVRVISDINLKIGKVQGEKDFHLSKLNKIKSLDICPTCTQKVSNEIKETVNQNLLLEVDKCKNKLLPLEKEFSLEQEVYKIGNNLKDKYSSKLIKLKELKDKLDIAIKQKDFKYSNKDILIMNECIKEIDYFYGRFITEWIKTLEPIMNSILDKINLKISFKDDFDIVLYKEELEYTYKEMSMGQKLILSLALKIAILLEQGEKGLIIADEGFSSLTEENIQYVLKLFKDLPFQLICVIHRYSTNDENINLIELEK
jgi:hypothetical protein